MIEYRMCPPSTPVASPKPVVNANDALDGSALVIDEASCHAKPAGKSFDNMTSTVGPNRSSFEPVAPPRGGASAVVGCETPHGESLADCLLGTATFAVDLPEVVIVDRPAIVEVQLAP